MSQQPGKVHRSPNFAAFLVSGGVIGLVVGLLVGVFGRADDRYDASAVLGFFGLICAGLGVLLGGLVAVLLDRRT